MVLSRAHLQRLTDSIELESLNQYPTPWCIVDAGDPLPESVPPERCIILIDSQGPAPIVEYAAASGCFHVIPVNHPFFADQIHHALSLMTKTNQVFVDPFALLLTSDANANFPKGQEFILTQEDKWPAIEKMLEQLKSYRPARTIYDNVLAISDELAMNALIDAPRFAGQQSTKPAELLWSCDSNRFVLIMRDHYGSMNVPGLLHRLNMVYTHELGGIINMGPGGAGIGMRLVFDRCSSLSIAVANGTQTLVCCTLNLNRSRRALESEEKSLHIIKTENV